MQKGSTEDFMRIYDAFLTYAYFVVQNTHHDKNEFDDIVQEAFLTVYITSHQLKNPESFPSWFNRILCGAVVQACRKNANTSVQYDEFFNEVIEMNENFLPESKFESNEMRQEVMNAVNELPDRQRQVIVAYYFQQLKITEIAESHQLSEGAIKNALYNARMALEKRLAPSVRTYTFTLPLSYIFQAEFEAFSAAVAGTVGLGVAQGLTESIEMASTSAQIATNAGVAGSITNAVAAVPIAVGVVAGGVSVATQIWADDPPPPETISQQQEAPIVVNTLADMIGEKDAALLKDLYNAQSKHRNYELSELMERNNIQFNSDHLLLSGKSASEYLLSKGGKSLYIVRAQGADEYWMAYTFKDEDASKQRLSIQELHELLLLLSDNTG
jgi:RNA polymerase sigma-70 factor (ECF subfamily)